MPRDLLNHWTMTVNLNVIQDLWLRRMAEGSGISKAHALRLALDRAIALDPSAGGLLDEGLVCSYLEDGGAKLNKPGPPRQ